MTRNNTHSPRKQRPSAQQLHDQHHRRALDSRPFLPCALPHRPLEQRITGGDAEAAERRSSLRRPSSSSSGPLQQQSRSKRPKIYHDLDRPREPDWMREPARPDPRRRTNDPSSDNDDDERRRRPRSSTNTSMALIRHPAAALLSPTPPPSQSMALVPRAATPAAAVGPLTTRSSAMMPHYMTMTQQQLQQQQQAQHERNRSIELTRLNHVMLQRNKAIADARATIESLQARIAALEADDVRAQLARRTEMAVALHGMAGRQQEFLRGGAVAERVYGEGPEAAEQRRMFGTWVQSNELYLAVVKRDVAAERDWDEVVVKAGEEALREIGKAAVEVARETEMFGQRG